MDEEKQHQPPQQFARLIVHAQRRAAVVEQAAPRRNIARSPFERRFGLAERGGAAAPLIGVEPARLGEHLAQPRAIEPVVAVARIRSEEHTSELQSLMRSSYASFCWTKKITTYD